MHESICPYGLSPLGLCRAALQNMTSWPLPLQWCNLCLMQSCMESVLSTVIRKGLGILFIDGKDCIGHDVIYE